MGALKIGTSKSPKWLKNLIAEKVKPAIVKELEKKIPKFMEKIIPQQEYLEPFIDKHVHTPLNSVVKRSGNAVANGIGYVGSAVGSGLGYVAGGLWSATKFTANLPLQAAKLPFKVAYKLGAKLGAAVGLVGSDPVDSSSSDNSSSSDDSGSECTDCNGYGEFKGGDTCETCGGMGRVRSDQLYSSASTVRTEDEKVDEDTHMYAQHSSHYDQDRLHRAQSDENNVKSRKRYKQKNYQCVYCWGSGKICTKPERKKYKNGCKLGNPNLSRKEKKKHFKRWHKKSPKCRCSNRRFASPDSGSSYPSSAA